MKISLLVTYYNQEAFVRESMDSLIALEKPAEWEILIGDDGSSDGTVEKVQAYVNLDPEHIRLYRMDRNPEKKYNPVERASANRLNLLRQATGDCCLMMDGDDFYSETDFLPQAISILEARSEVTVVGFDTWMYRDGSPERRKRGGSGKTVSVPRRKYLRWQYTHAGACLFRRDPTGKDLEEPTRLQCFDDNGIVMNALARGKMIRIHRPVYAYRQTGNSVYTGMRPEERASLNLMGLGAGLRFMGPDWEKDVIARFATAIWMTWFLRGSMREKLDPEKYQHYLESCRRAGFRPGELLMRYPELKAEERREIHAYVRRAGWLSPLRVLYAWIATRRC